MDTLALAAVVTFLAGTIAASFAVTWIIGRIFN